MSAVLWVLGILGYFAVGVGLARLRARHVMRKRFRGDDLRAEMLLLMVFWPVMGPVYVVVAVICLVLFPRSLR